VRSVIEDGYPSLVLRKEVEDFVTSDPIADLQRPVWKE
jgi:hypothetical protein